MLRKMIKHEWIQTSKFVLTAYLVLLLATIIGSFGLRNMQADAMINDFWSIFSVVLFCLYVIAFIGIFTLIVIYLFMHYYKTMHSSQGYLTFTLPINVHTILGAKLLTGSLWLLLSSVLAILSVGILLVLGVGPEVLSEVFDFGIPELQEALLEMEAEIGMNALAFLVICMVSLLLSIPYNLLFVYLSMAIGQLFHANKVAFSVVAGFCLYIFGQISSTILLLCFGFRNYLQMDSANSPSQILSPSMFYSGLLLTILYTLIMYFATHWILSKKLNLE